MAYGYALENVDELLARDDGLVAEIGGDLAEIYLDLGRADDAHRVAMAALERRPGDERLVSMLARVRGEDPPMTESEREFIHALRAIAGDELSVVRSRRDTLELRLPDGDPVELSEADAAAGRPGDPAMGDDQRLSLAAVRAVSRDALHITVDRDGGLRVTNAAGSSVVVERDGHLRPLGQTTNLRGMTRPSLYEFAGGGPAFLALATAHHARCLADPELNHPFSHDDQHPQHVERLAAYWAEVLGGPPAYSASCGDQSGVLKMHSGNGDMSDLGDRFVACFVAAMDDAGLPGDPEFRAAMAAYMRWAVDDVLVYSPVDASVPAGEAMPRWGWAGLASA